MTLEFRDSLSGLTTHKASQLVVRDAHGNPIFLAIELGPNQIVAATASQDNALFQSLLRQFNIGLVKVSHTTPDKLGKSSTALEM